MSNEFTQQRILGNHANLVRGAALTASAQRPSTDLRLLAESRQGHGQLTLVGPYTGAADTTVEVEILSGSGTGLRPSAPVLAGVGSGTLQVLSLDAGAVPETVTMKLVSAGTSDVHAELPFYGATLRARVAGAAGNLLRVTVTRNLSLGATQWAVLAEIPAGTAALEGSQYDWGAVPGSDNRIPAAAPRIAFDGHPQVHRHWRTWEGDHWVYRLDPPPLGAVAADTRVLAVSGNYTLTVSDGTSNESYTAVTVFEALREIAARSTLLEVLGVVAEDRAPGGMAVTDIPLRTDAHALAVEARIQGPYGARRLDAVTVRPDAPTEVIEVTRLSSGRWAVNGPVSGPLPEAAVGIPYQAGPLGFTVPHGTVPDSELADISADVKTVSRTEEQGLPAICVHSRLGVAAVPKTITFVYTRKPPADCVCDSLPAPPVSLVCLGLIQAGAFMDYPEAVATRLTAAYQWRESYVRANTAWRAGRSATFLPGSFLPGTDSGYVVSGWVGQPSPQGFGFVLDTVYATLETAQIVATAITGNAISIVAPSQVWQGTPVTIGGKSAKVTRADGANVGTISPTMWVRAVTEYREGTPSVSVPGDEVPAVEAQFTAASKDLAWLDAALGIVMPCLVEVGDDAEALLAWDGLWAEVQVDLGRLDDSTGDDQSGSNPDYLRRYAAACDNIRIAAGIFPTFDAASRDTGACWHDIPGAAYWWVDNSGEYLPAFTEKGYVSCRRRGGQVVSTQEFGFSLAISCPQYLLEGDSITLTIRGSAYDGYTVGDSYRVPLVAGAAAAFGGGAPGDPTQTWALAGSVSGPWPDWAWDPGDPLDYVGASLSMRLTPGGLPFAVGDAWELRIEGGQLRWRRDAGMWATEDLYGDAPSLGDGLSLEVAGASAPSFVAGDAWTWQALATYGPEQLRAPREGRAWAWDGASATLDIDLGAVRPIESVLLALHGLPGSATITIAGGALTPADWSLTPAWRAGPILALTAAGSSARYLRLSIANCGAGGGSLGWLWVGVPWAPSSGATTMEHVRQYALARGGGRNPSGVYRGRGMGGHWAWDLDAGGALTQANAEALLALLDHVAEQGLEPVCLVPDVARASAATLVQIDVDEVRLTEHLGFALDGEALVSADLPFRGLLA